MVGVLPSTILSESVARADLVRLPISLPNTLLEYGIGTRREEPLSANALEFISVDASAVCHRKVVTVRNQCGWLLTMRGYVRERRPAPRRYLFGRWPPKAPQAGVLLPAFMSVGHEHGERDMIKQVAGGATENQLAHAALCVSSLDQQVGPKLLGIDKTTSPVGRPSGSTSRA